MTDDGLDLTETVSMAIGGMVGGGIFASLAFITIFDGMSWLAFTRRESVVTAVVPGIGTVGTTAAVVSLLYHLFTTEFDTFVVVVVLAILVVVVELLYFEREPIERELREVEESI